ncbi:MAG: DnaJ domain-containing protein [Dehalococcoidia bacterium]
MGYHLHTDKSIYDTERDLEETFMKWGVTDYAVEFNVPRSRLRNVTLTATERGVTVRWMPASGGREVVLSHAGQLDVASNLRVLYLGIESIRMNERRGIDPTLMKSAYLQLDVPSTGWPAVLGVSQSASRDEIQAAYRAAAKTAHPDAGGSDAAMAALNRARDEALAAVPR